MNLPKNLVMKAEEIEELKRQNQLLSEQNQLLTERNQALSKYSQTLTKQNQEFRTFKVEIVNLKLMIQKTSLSRLTLVQIFLLLQDKLIKHKYLTETFLKADAQEIRKNQELTVEKIQELENQLKNLSQ